MLSWAFVLQLDRCFYPLSNIVWAISSIYEVFFPSFMKLFLSMVYVQPCWAHLPISSFVQVKQYRCFQSSFHALGLTRILFGVCPFFSGYLTCHILIRQYSLACSFFLSVDPLEYWMNITDTTGFLPPMWKSGYLFFWLLQVVLSPSWNYHRVFLLFLS